MALLQTTLLQPAKKAGRKYLNPLPTQVGGLKLMLKILPLYLTNREEREPKALLGPFRTDTAIYSTPPESGLRITWFGHSSSLVEIDRVRILIDPVWDPRASPTPWFGPKRFFAPTLALEDLPKLDAILISHDHYDHLGARTIRRLATSPNAANARWVTSLGVGSILQRFGVPATRITELDWTQSATVTAPPGGTCEIVASPPATSPDAASATVSRRSGRRSCCAVTLPQASPIRSTMVPTPAYGTDSPRSQRPTAPSTYR
jgi:hypothetical protein